MAYDLFCLGKATTDYVVKVDDNLLKDFGLQKGIGKQLSADAVSRLEKAIQKYNKMPGGSTANVAAGLANISTQLKIAYAAAIGDDENGKAFEKEMQEKGIDCYLKRVSGRSPVCFALVTPDGERTFVVDVGVATQYKPEDLPCDAIRNSRIFHSDAYELLSSPDALITAINLAYLNGTKISFDIAHEKVVKKERQTINTIINAGFCSFLFANEKEFAELTQSSELETAAMQIARRTLSDFRRNITVVVKLGEKGAIVAENGLTYKIPIFRTNAIDTNGAGDAFAAGFLYGKLCGYETEMCGKIGSFYASKVVAQLGPRLKERIDGIEEMIK